MNEAMNEAKALQYATETLLNDAFIKKTLWASIGVSWRKTYYIVCGVLYAVMMAIILAGALITGEFTNFYVSLLIGVVVLAFAVLLLRYSVGVSLRRWKEQNHGGELRITSGFTDEVLTFCKDENRSTILFSDMYKLFPVDGVWIFRTKAGLLVNYNAAALTDAERADVLSLLHERCPKLKVRL